MKNFFQYFALVVLLLAVGACSSDEPSVPLSSDKLLKSFSILKSNNPDLIVADCEGVVSDQTITIRLDKYDCLQGLKPTFKYMGKQVKINGAVQVSGETSNDFSTPLTLTVEAQDGTTVDYQVVVELAESHPMQSFTFLKSVNEGLGADKKCAISGTQILGTFSQLPAVLIPTFESSALSVKVGGVLQESGKSGHDFSKPVA